MSRRSVLGLTLVVALLAAGPVRPAAASTVVGQPRSLAELAGASDLVLIGTVVSASGHWTADGVIVTRVQLLPGEVLKGQAPGPSVTFEQPGGRAGDTTMAIAGVPRFHPGERVLVFLRRQAGDRLAAVAPDAGKFTVEPGASGDVVARRGADGPGPLEVIALDEARRRIGVRP